MSRIPCSCVVDASVGIKLFIDEPFSKQAHWLFNGLSAEPPAILHVPDLFFIECTNILWKYTRRFNRKHADSQADLIDLGRLALQVFSTAILMEDAFSIATQTGLTAYNACYAALAQRLNLQLITADKLLIETISWAIWLGDLEELP